MKPQYTFDLPHGHCVAVEIPPELTPELRSALHSKEQEYLDQLGPGRQASFAAGRVALRAALMAVASGAAEARYLEEAVYLPGPTGGPTLPAGFLASISHKRALAIALAAAAEAGAPTAALGVDLEEDRRLRLDISRRVLTRGERLRAAALPPPDRDRNLIRHFSLKESFYKAVNGFGLAHVSFHDVEVTEISANGAVQFASPVLLEQQLAISGWIGNPIGGYIIASVRADQRVTR